MSTSPLHGASSSAVGGAAGPRAGRPPRPTSLSRQSPRYGERLALTGLAGAALLSVLVTVGIVVALVVPALEFFQTVSVVEFLTGTKWAPRFENQEAYGVLPLVTGTLWTTVISLAIAIPFGLGAAVYLSEYAPSGVRKVLKPVLELLAGIPSVVYGFFALTFIAPVVLQQILSIEVGTFSVLAAGIALGIMIIPTVASLSEDAMSAVPNALRQGSLALGANRMRTTLRVVFPAAISGIAASIVLGLSRAVGETMIVALAAGTQPRMVASPTELGQTMTGYIAQTATGESTPGTIGYDSLYAVGLLLFLLTLVINIISIRLVRKFREAY
ncbi:phosphate ABC transporter permease subunit PstC [Actinotalea sp.]|uniref:phosphate ABC transporter permease subunit PstC n=1 Tax=Actinotalea sp. TaxID=1872145 RepID=UPI002D1A0C88|nr:phosphate ABC transporter permease subunit PstC [Actinotalea sp.]HQY32701.1 phosphate ABC transporter permease subunit PstC [Actinotalea sp.]HRA50780.1 phosphate ABC transporter permease subunit PstC [Actinotalea sp.]